MTELTKKDFVWDWTDACRGAFDDLEAAVANAPTLHHPLFELPFVLETDASNFAIGAVLSQYANGNVGDDLVPVGFFSRKMVQTERNYDVHDRELLAIICALDHWSHYLSGSAHVLRIITDHRNLIHFQNKLSLSPRQLRWKMFLAQYNFALTYRRGDDNIPADLLSRHVDFCEEGVSP